MKLIEYQNYTIKVTNEALLVKPIRTLFNKDKSANKEKFMQQLSIIYFMADPRSSYSYIIDEKERLEQILIQEGLGVDYKMSQELKDALNIYKKLSETSSSKLLEDARIAVDKVRTFLRDVDLNQLDKNDKPVYQVSTITNALKQVPQLAKDLIETEKIVTKELEDQGRARGGNSTKKLFEDGF